MSQDMLETLRAIDIAVLTDIVRQDQRSPTFEILDWNVKWLSSKGVVNPDGLFLFSGDGQDEKGTRPWSVVLKILKDPGEPQEPDKMWYWKRELLAVQTGLLANLPGPVMTPRTYGTSEPEGSGWIWMEHIVENTSSTWTLDQYAFAARQLGRSDGSYLTGTPLPDYPWLLKGLARYWARAFPPHDAWENPYVARAFSDLLRQRILGLWDENEIFCDALDRLPQVFSHFDFHRRNLFLRQQPGEQQAIVAIDWANCGIGAVGAGLSSLLAITILFLEVEVQALRDLERVVFEAYLAGLHDVGWAGNPDLARLGYAAFLGVCFSTACPTSVIYWTVEVPRSQFTAQFNRSPEDFAAVWAAICELSLDRADEARQLMGRLL